MGPRRVGKTVLLHHVIAHLLDRGDYAARDIGYVSRWTSPCTPDSRSTKPRTKSAGRAEILTARECFSWTRSSTWPIGSATSRCSSTRIPASSAWCPARRRPRSGSRASNREPAASRTSCCRRSRSRSISTCRVSRASSSTIKQRVHTHEHRELNRHFVDYVNFGGYPESISSPAIRSDPARYIGTDIIEKVLLRDLPSLYGIQDVQELNALFMTLAYNTAGEVSLEDLSRVRA